MNSLKLKTQGVYKVHPRMLYRVHRPAAVIVTLLLASGDIESNPGPVQYPCTVCAPPPKSKKHKRKREEEDEKKEEGETETDKRVRRGGEGRERGRGGRPGWRMGRHVENVSVAITNLVYTTLIFIYNLDL